MPHTKDNLNNQVSVIVPAHEVGEDLIRCLKSLQSLDPKPHEVIIVFDGKVQNLDNPPGYLNIRILETVVNGGPGRARNWGAQNASGDILFFVDSDVTLNPNAINLIELTFNAHPQYCALIGSYDNAPYKKNFLSQYKNLMHHYVHQTSSEEASTFWGACGAIQKEIFLKSGGFDESYSKPSIEDIEFGYRLRNAGYRIRLCKQLQVKHLKRWSIKSLIQTDFFCRALPWSKLILRNKGMLNDLNLKLSHRISTILTYLTLLTLLCSFWLPLILAVSSISFLFTIIINYPFYRFFQQNRGFIFTLKVIPWHVFYYFYSGLAFGISFIQYRFSLKDNASRRM